MTEQTQNPENENPETLETTTPESHEETPPSPPSYEDLQARVTELEGMLKDEQLRSLANEQNLNRRFQEELQKTHKFAAQKFASEMLTVCDYLEMALLDQSGNFDAMKMGVSMTLDVLKKAFENTQIQEINPQKGDKLDPHKHQGMQEVEEHSVEAGTIVSLLKKGYTMHDRVLRPAMVTVAKAETSSAEAEHHNDTTATE